MSNNIVIEIELTTDPQYIPSNVAKHGDTVTFRLGAGVPSATVSFDKGSCLDTPGPFNLNDSSLAASQTTNPIAVSAEGFYPFTVTIPEVTTPSLKRGDHEVKRGGIDVATDTRD